MKQRLVPILAACAALLAACAGAPFAAAPTPTAFPKLPTVTPMPTAGPPTSIPPTPTARPTTAPATPTPAPAAVRATNAVTETADGPVTEPMAALDLTAERYAALGDPRAPVTIIEFADHGCPFCRMFALTTFPRLRDAYITTGKVYYVRKDLPVVSARGDMAAEAAQCAGEQGDYWGMHEQLAIATDEWNGSKEAALAAFGRYAGALKLDAKKLESCVSSGRFASVVERDTQEAFNLHIRSTPIFVINHKVMIGAQPFDSFAAAIDAELRQ